MVTVTFIRFPRKKVLYALAQMQLAHKALSKIEGAKMYKLMGSGAGNGFSIWPDWQVFSLLIHWDDEQKSKNFFQNNQYFQSYTGKANKHFTIYLTPTRTKGTWDGLNPFEQELKAHDNGRIAVLTRATIKKRFIPYFWSKVPKASRLVPEMKGHIFSKGVGELPLFLQATISVWESKEDMYNYAYKHDDHIQMIRKTKELGWYSEEMFTEFNVLKIDGEVFL